MKTHAKSILAGMLTLGMMACGTNEVPVEGTWVQPVPGMEQMEQGFTLAEGGTASSVNMATLQYETWKLDGSNLVLTGKSLGNGQTIAFADTFVVESLTADSLVIKRDALTLRYSRKQ